MIRTFDEWKKSLLIEFKNESLFNEKPFLNNVNYIWLNNLMNGNLELNPSVDELLDWIITEQIDAIRK